MQPSDPFVPQSHSGPSLVKTCKIDIPTVSSGIVNQYIQLLDNQGEGFEIEKVELKKKRKRLVKAYKSEAVKEGIKEKTKTKVGSSESEESDDEPLSVRLKKLTKEPEKKIAEGSNHDKSGDVSLSKPFVVTTQDTHLTSSSTQPIPNYNQASSEDNLTIKQLISEPVKSKPPIPETTHPEPEFINISSSSSSVDLNPNELDEILASFELLNAKAKHKIAQPSMTQTSSDPHTPKH